MVERPLSMRHRDRYLLLLFCLRGTKNEKFLSDKKNIGENVIPVALCLTYGGQVIVSLVTQDIFCDFLRFFAIVFVQISM